MAGRIYTFGYGGRKPEELKAAAEELQATVVDVRIVPNTRVPGWSRGPLQAALGERYQHVRALGNVNYKGGGEIKLVNEPAGLDYVRRLLDRDRNVILLCAESDPVGCHRTYIAGKLAEAGGYEVRHLRKNGQEPLL